MKFNDFTLVDYSKNGRNDSKFYNIKNLSENYKIVTYFLNYFSNPKIMTLINHNGQLDPYAFKNDLPNSIYKRIDIMAEYIMDEKTSFYDLKHVIDITPTKDVNIELLKTVLAVKGSTSAENIREHAPKTKVLELENYAEAFTALQSGQGDAMTTDNSILLGMAAENPQYILAGDKFTDEPYGIALNKGQEEFQSALNEGLEKIRENGEYRKIYKKWFNEEPK